MMKKSVGIICLIFVFLVGCNSMTDTFPDSPEGKLASAMYNAGVHEPLEEAIEQGADLNTFSEPFQESINGKRESNPLRIGMHHFIDRYTVDRMLCAGADPDAYDQTGNPLIFYSAWSNDEQLYEVFAVNGADLSLQNVSGETLLEYYLQQNGTQVRRRFVETMLRQGVPIRKETLELARKKGIYHVLDLLYGNLLGADDSFSKLQRCFLTGEVSKGNELLKAKTTLDSDDIGFAVIYGNRETIEILSRRGIHFTETLETYDSALFAAAYGQNCETVSAMLDDTQRESVELQALCRIIYETDDVKIFQALCERNWIQEEQISDDELEQICLLHGEQIIRYLLANGYDLCTHPVGGMRALGAAVQAESPKMLSLLLSSGADPNAEQEFFDLPLIKSCMYGDPKCIRILLEGGADLNVAGEDALLEAVRCENLEAVKILREAGVCVSEEAYVCAKENSGCENSHTWEYVERWYEEQKR